MRISRTLLTLAIALAPLSTSAHMVRNHVLVPEGFCTVASDNTLGVRFDGSSYASWLAAYAASEITINDAAKFEVGSRASRGLPPMTDMDLQDFKAKFKADVAWYQLSNVRHGQASLCR